MKYPWIMCAARAFTLAALPITLLSSAHAGDAAARKIIGFSPDGASFAFEQYSQLYQSADIMAKILVMEIRTDSSVKSTGFTSWTWGNSKPDITTLRAELGTKAKPLLDKFGIAEPGTRFAGKPSMALDEIGTYPIDQKPLAKAQELTLPDGRKLVVELSEHAAGTASCDGVGGPGVKGNVAVAGMTLRISINGGAPVMRHHDETPPDDHRCVTAYGIAEIYHHQAQNDAQTLAVLIEIVDADGTRDGPNRRFMAATTKLPAK